MNLVDAIIADVSPFKRLILIVLSLLLILCRDFRYLLSAVSFRFSMTVAVIAAFSFLVTACNSVAWLPSRIYLCAVFALASAAAILGMTGVSPIVCKSFAGISVAMTLFVPLFILILLICFLFCPHGKPEVTPDGERILTYGLVKLT